MRKPSSITGIDYWATSQDSARSVRRDALDAVHEVNEQLLDALCQNAAASDAPFPLAHPLRARVAGLTADDRRQIAQCGVLLVDAGFSDCQLWSEAINDTGLGAPARPSCGWLSIEHAISLAHSTLLVAWHVVRASPAIASVLLGMSSESAAAYTRFGVRDLAYIAQRHSNWMRPRWQHRPEIWGALLDLAATVPEPDAVSMTLRCLQLSGGHAPWLVPYVEMDV
jgi:hypothetical protein